MRRTARLAGAIVGVGMMGAIALAQAFATFQPGGSGPTGNFRDANGAIEMRRGGTATWADGSGRLQANDPTLTKSADGEVTDNKECTGVIVEAVNPQWTWAISAGMTVSSDGYLGAAFNDKVEGGARGELALWGDGGPAFAAAEVVTTNQHPQGRYDIDIIVDGVTNPIANGGSYHKLGNQFGGGGGARDIRTGQAFVKFGSGWRLTYESRASGWVEIDFTAAGRERASFSVSQANAQWTGFVQAWDFGPSGPTLLGIWTLD